MKSPHTHHILVPVLSLAAVAALASAGPLSPPSGAIAPTGKTVQEIFDKVAVVSGQVASAEPRTPITQNFTPGDASAMFKITQSGSYYLTGNITGVSGKSGIVIAASGVTIDLNGYQLQGVSGSVEGIGVSATPGVGLQNLAVCNGTIRGWGGAGLNLTNGACRNARVTGVSVHSCGGSGISAGTDSVITGCACTFNSGAGIAVQSDSVVIGCTASVNSAHGVYAESGCTIKDCSAQGNLFNGIAASDASLVTDNSVGSNHWDGVRVSNKCRVYGNNAADNGFASGSGAGVHATGSGNRIEGNNCTGADIGIDIDAAGNFITRNTCSTNSLNFSVVAGNACYVVSANVSGAISGNSGGLSLGTNDPSANYTY